jgi:hypothetical protein
MVPMPCLRGRHNCRRLPRRQRPPGLGVNRPGRGARPLGRDRRGGLKRLPETPSPKLPRMADFALRATACETALRPAGTFWSAYCGNRDSRGGDRRRPNRRQRARRHDDAYGVDGNRLGPSGRPGRGGGRAIGGIGTMGIGPMPPMVPMPSPPRRGDEVAVAVTRSGPGATPAGGFVLTRQEAGGKWGVTTNWSRRTFLHPGRVWRTRWSSSSPARFVVHRASWKPPATLPASVPGARKAICSRST